MTHPKPMKTPDLAGLLTRRDPASPAARPASESPARPVLVPAADDAGTGIAEEVHGNPARPASINAAPAPRRFTRSITVYLPRELSTQLAVESARSGLSRTAIMLLAVNQTHHHLQADSSKDETPVGEDLFTVPQARHRTPPAAQTTIRVTDDQLDVLDRLAARAGMTRSHLLSQAVQLYLDERR